MSAYIQDALTEERATVFYRAIHSYGIQGGAEQSVAEPAETTSLFIP